LRKERKKRQLEEQLADNEQRAHASALEKQFLPEFERMARQQQADEAKRIEARENQLKSRSFCCCFVVEKRGVNFLFLDNESSTTTTTTTTKTIIKPKTPPPTTTTSSTSSTSTTTKSSSKYEILSC
jgi:hypothetical protein